MPSPTIMLAIALAISLLANAGLGKLYLGKRDELATEKQKMVRFVAGVKVIGEAAEKKAKETKAADDKLKKETDDEHLTKVAGLESQLAGMRKRRTSPGGNIVPPAPSVTKRPEIIAFDRAEFDRAVQRYEEGVEGLVGEGAKAVVNMDSALKWATELRR